MPHRPVFRYEVHRAVLRVSERQRDGARGSPIRVFFGPLAPQLKTPVTSVAVTSR